MTEHAASVTPAHSTNYVKIWGILVGLLVVSVAGPMLEIRFITLLTAFGVAILKAYLVARYFMHLGVERRWVGYLLLTMVALMLVMVGGVAPDVLRHEGARWQNVAAKAAVERGAGAEPNGLGSAQTPAAPPGSAGKTE
jgi:caa(3)-type oxidase subunit IV